jgi:hypothetical protein
MVLFAQSEQEMKRRTFKRTLGEFEKNAIHALLAKAKTPNPVAAGAVWVFGLTRCTAGLRNSVQ